MKRYVALSLLSVLFSAPAFASTLTVTSCEPLSIMGDPSIKDNFSQASVILNWRGPAANGDLQAQSAQNLENYFFVKREDGKESQIDVLKVDILKRVDFETNEYGGFEGSPTTVTTSTLKIRLTSPQYEIGISIREGDIASPSKSATGIVICTTSVYEQ